MVTPLVQPPPTQYEVLCWRKFHNKNETTQIVEGGPQIKYHGKIVMVLQA